MPFVRAFKVTLVLIVHKGAYCVVLRTPFPFSLNASEAQQLRFLWIILRNWTFRWTDPILRGRNVRMVPYFDAIRIASGLVGSTPMEEREFKDAIERLHEVGVHFTGLLNRIRPVTEEQALKIGDLIAQQMQECNRILNRDAQTKENVEPTLIAARRAAQQAYKEQDKDQEKRIGSWRTMWIALAVMIAVVMLSKLFLR